MWNSVPILIILIVIAGVKVARQPPPAPLPPPPVTIAEEPSAAIVVDAAESAADAAAMQVRHPLPLPPVPAVFVAEPQPADAPLAVVPRDFSNEKRKLAVLADREQVFQQELQALDNQVRGLSDELERQRTSTANLRGRLISLQQEDAAGRVAAVRLQTQLRHAETPRVHVEQIEHKVTPVGADVTGDEAHFRLMRGRVAWVPVDALLAELKRDAQRQQRWLLQNPTYHGRVGPIRGFRMSYEIVRRQPSLADATGYYAPTMFRVVVSEWKVEETVDLEAETVAQALQPGSLFARQLLQLDADTNVTFWVYPDSFDEYRTLQSVVHQHGFRVAGRPLPFGVEIAGSPNGTRSSGQ